MNSARDLDKQAADWAAARDGSSWTPARQQALEEWLAASTAHRVAFVRAEFAWKQADRLQVLHSSPATSTQRRSYWVDALSRWLASRRPTGWTIGAGVAACLVAVVGIVMLGYDGDSKAQQLATGVGEKAVLALNDGSRLTLNTSTRIRTEMRQDERKVWLDDGEAFFEVAHDASRPFYVYSGSSRIKVLGTKFTVFKSGNSVQVAVVEGHVELASGESIRQLLAKADTAAVLPGVIRVRHVTKSEIDAGMSWLSGQLQFNGVELSQAAEQFNRYNNKKLLIADHAAAAIIIGGTFQAANVEQFSRLLSSGFGLVVKEEGDTIRVSSPTRAGT